jgi:hypothetical protein
MEAVHVSETSIHFNETTQRYIPEECHLHTCCRENLNPHNFLNIYIWCAVLSLVILLFHSVNIALLSSTIYDICTWYCIITYPFLHTHKMLLCSSVTIYGYICLWYLQVSFPIISIVLADKHCLGSIFLKVQVIGSSETWYPWTTLCGTIKQIITQKHMQSF